MPSLIPRAAALVFFAGLPSLHAATTSNLSYLDTSWAGDTITSTVYLSSSFTTNASAGSYTLDSVTINLGDALTETGGFFLRIMSQTSSRPGTLIGTLSGETNPSGGLYTYTPSATITLNANTTYWLVAGVTGTGEYRWLSATGSNQTGDWTIGNNISTSMNTGSSWTNRNFPPYLFSVTATAIPEPSSSMVITTGATMLFLRRRRPSLA